MPLLHNYFYWIILTILFFTTIFYSYFCIAERNCCFIYTKIAEIGLYTCDVNACFFLNEYIQQILADNNAMKMLERRTSCGWQTFCQISHFSLDLLVFSEQMLRTRLPSVNKTSCWLHALPSPTNFLDWIERGFQVNARDTRTPPGSVGGLSSCC